MRTHIWMRHLAWGILGLVSQQAFPQATQANNNGGATFFLGWNNLANQILEVRNDANQRIEWYTDNTRRMLLQESASYQIGPFPNQSKYGSLLLCPKVDGFYNNGAKGPFSLLHLAADDYNAQQASYRPWMNVGITFTGNRDHDYIGQKARTEHGEPLIDYTDMVAHWSDNPGEHLKDRFRFIFTSGYDALATTGAQSEEGLEFLRMWAAKYDDPRIGIGDWYAANLADPVNVTEPSERLDIVNGRVRIRQLPTDAIAPTLTKFLVVDDTPGPDFGVVKWRNVPPGTGGGCEWTLLGAPGSSSNIATAYNGNPGCPQGERSVCIGTPTSAGKLTVLSLGGESGPSMGASITVKRDATSWVNGLNVVVDKETATGTSDYQSGIKGLVTNGRVNNVALSGYGTISSVATTKNHGVYGYALVTGVDASAQFNYGGYYYGSAVNGATIGTNYGLYTEGYGGDSNYGIYAKATGGATNIGVYATASGSAGSTWAFWSQGNQFSSTGTAWTFSDENLKTNITDLNGGLETIMQLHPKTYLFRTDEYPYLQMADGHQYGLLAQEMEQVVPDLVRDVHRPADIDSLGNEIGPALDFKAVKYEGLIPILIAAVQEQQATIAQLQDQINNCCAAQGGLEPQGGLERRMASKENDLQEQRLLIIPNPVADLTTLEYYVPQAGRVSLSVSSSDGKPLGTLREEQAEPGAYSYPWNTTKLAAGTYFCTYLLDGAVVVKRAVKVE